MAVKRVQRLRHTSAALASFAGLDGELTIDTTNRRIALHNGGGAGTHVEFRDKTANDLLYQPLATLLTALAAATATDGVIAKTGAATVAARTLTAGNTGISVSNGGGASGNPTISVSTLLQAFHGLTATGGIAAKTGADTVAARTITGTANQISITNGDGSAGNPTIAFTTNITLPGALTLGGAITGGANVASNLELKDTAFTHSAIGTAGGAQSLDYTVAHSFSITPNATTTFSFTNPSATGKIAQFILEITNGGAQTVNWPASVDWPGGTAPTLTTSGTDILAFHTRDGGTIWHGAVIREDTQ